MKRERKEKQKTKKGFASVLGRMKENMEMFERDLLKQTDSFIMTTERAKKK